MGTANMLSWHRYYTSPYL